MSQTKAQLIDPTDGSIVNADINDSAAIAGSKISPTFTSTVNVTNTLPEIFLTDTNTNNARGRLNANGGGLLLGADNDNAAADSVISFAVDGGEKARIDSSGRLLIGTTSARSSGGAGTAHLQLEGTSSPSAEFLITRNSADPFSPVLGLVKTRGTSVGSNTSVADDDKLGTIQFRGADGSDIFAVGASIFARVNGTPSDGTDMPAELVFATSADGSHSPTERMSIDSSGRVLIGTTTEGSTLGDDLTIAQASGAAGITIRTANDTVGSLLFSDATSGTGEYAGFVQYSHSSDEMVIGANSSETVKIHDEHFNIVAPEGTLRMNFGFTNTLGGELSLYNEAGSQKTRITGSADTHHFFNNGGNVGIGLNAPEKPLHIFRQSIDSEIRLQTNSGTEQNAYITLRNSGGVLDLYSVNSNIQLHADNTKRGTVNVTSGITGIEHFHFIHPTVGSTDGGSTVSNPVLRFNAAAFAIGTSNDFISFSFNSHWRHRAYADVGIWYGESGNRSGATYDLTISVQSAASGVGYTQTNHSFTSQIGTFSNGKMRKHSLTSSWPTHAADRFVQGTITFTKLQSGISLQYMGMRVVEYTNPA